MKIKQLGDDEADEIIFKVMMQDATMHEKLSLNRYFLIGNLQVKQKKRIGHSYGTSVSIFFGCVQRNSSQSRHTYLS